MRSRWKLYRRAGPSDAIDDEKIPRSRYLFVGFVFALLGLSFIASTLSVLREFAGTGATTIVFAHSHLFLFFPTLGISALIAFYFPAVVFTDIYWRRLAKFGRVRFVFGFFVWVALSLGVTHWFATSDLRAIWEISPSVLNAEAQAVGRCSGGSDCRKASLLGALGSLREAAQHRSTISEFARTCVPDDLLEPADVAAKRRHCFAAGDRLDDPGAKLDAAQCCTAQRALRRHLRDVWEDPRNRSEAARLDAVFFALKVAFILVIVLIGGLLMFWRRTLYQHYARHVQAIDRCVMIGALVMLFWPLMDYAYQQTTDVLFGRENRGFTFRMSLVLAPWAVFLLLYFSDPFGKGLENLARMVTMLGSIVAVLRYQDIVDASARALGVGAADWHFIVIVLAAALMLVAVYWRPRTRQRVRYHRRTRRLGHASRYAEHPDRRLT